MELPAVSNEYSRSDSCYNEASAGISSNGGRLHKLELSGRFSPGWMGRLSAGLANYRINVLRGRAEKISSMEWSATLELDFFESLYIPSNVDFIRLANETKTACFTETVKLDNFRLEKTSRHDNSLYVELTGPDRIGFLAAIINMFSMYSLHPLEFSIETGGNLVHDRFWLKGLGGMPPSESAAEAVKDRLTFFSAADS